MHVRKTRRKEKEEKEEKEEKGESISLSRHRATARTNKKGYFGRSNFYCSLEAKRVVLRVKILLKYHWMRDVTFVFCCAGRKHSNECATSTHLLVLSGTRAHHGSTRLH